MLFHVCADGEEVAREHLHAELDPQLQKDRSEYGSPRTAGGAYASRDDVRSEGKSDSQYYNIQQLLVISVASIWLKTQLLRFDDDQFCFSFVHAASQPTKGMTDEQIVAEQTAGTTIHPDRQDKEKESDEPPGFAGTLLLKYVQSALKG